MIRIFNYWCLNSDCKDRDHKIQKDSSEEKEEELCPSCGGGLKLLGTEMSGGYMKFASADDKTKKEIISKRAQKYYERYEKKDVEHKKLQTYNDIRQQAGVPLLKKLPDKK